MALVFDFMVNGNLEKWLHPVDNLNQEEEQRYLNIMQRLNIAIDVASALDYLHNGSHIPIAHCDLKPSNVLLDANMTAHVGDFGLAKYMVGTSFQNKSTESGSISIRGTIGYAPPEESKLRGDHLLTKADSAKAMARARAAALFWHSCCSSSGLLSATIPAPA